MRRAPQLRSGIRHRLKRLAGVSTRRVAPDESARIIKLPDAEAQVFSLRILGEPEVSVIAPAIWTLIARDRRPFVIGAGKISGFKRSS